MVQFAEKVVNELFTVKTSKAMDAGALNLLSTKEKYEFIGRSIGNNSIQGYLSDKAKPYFDPNEANTISISQIGQQIATYHENEYYASQNMFVLKPIDFKLNRITGLYFTTIFNCQLKQYLGSYTSYPTQNDVKQWKIKVPVTPSGELDTEYMASYVRKIEASYVRKIEASYVRKIEAYLAVLGYKSLADCQLNQHDLDVLHAKPKMGGIKVGKLFNINPTKALNITNDFLFDKNGKYPVVTNSEVNNGITGYSNYKPTMPANMITFSDTTSERSIFLQTKPFIGYSHVQGLHPVSDHPCWTNKQLLYFMSVFRKASTGKYNYGTKFNREKASNEIVLLPVTSSGDPDWQFMEDYITAIEKRKVLKLKQFLDHKLDLYQKVIH